jgi:pimeloyl-ACP methyl ester carboxylesterase
VINDKSRHIGLAFIPGAGLGSWIWRELPASLNLPHLFTNYPLREADARARKDLRLADYADHVRDQIAQFDVERVVIVAHSIGGVVGLKVAAQLGDRLAGIVGVGAVFPAGGGSFVSAFPQPQRLVTGTVMRLFGTKPPTSAIRKTLASDLPTELADEVIERFTPESRRLYVERTGVGRLDVPAAYVRLTNDKAVEVGLQDVMARNVGASEVHDLASGHLAMLSKPRELAAALAACTSSLSQA